jgi:putative transposase
LKQCSPRLCPQCSHETLPTSKSLSETLGVQVLKTSLRAPQANAFCERVIGTIRRECLDFLIPFNERHLKRILKEGVTHYNQERPHSSLGPGIPDGSIAVQTSEPQRHGIPRDCRIVAKPILASLHHEYRLEKRDA